MAASLLKLEHVSRSFVVNQGFWANRARLLAVDDVSLELEAGESLGLVGESGCGKSTLGQLACGLIKPDSGSILFQERRLPLAGARSWAAGRMQMIFQDPASSLDPRMTVGNSIGEPLRARNTSLVKRREAVANILHAVGLADMANRYPHQFSGGQRQRLAVARALITRPEVVVCDEPVSALDASVQAQILNLLKELQESFKPAYLFISHDLAVIGFMCQKILVMYLGQIVEKAPREDLFLKPGHPYSAALLAAMPKGEDIWKEGRGLSKMPPALPGELPSPINPPSGCHFHPRCLKAQKICSEQPPPWRQLGTDWFCRCHFPNH